jgi:short-subunit dehydrogenase
MITSHTTAAPARALITGASSGLGAALSRQLAARGVEVWLAARRAPRLEHEVARIRAEGGRAHALVLDVADAERSAQRLAQLDAETGGIDLVVANAGLAGMRAVRPLAQASWRHTSELIQTNLLGAAATITPFIPGMLARGHGHLVGVSSALAELPNASAPAYSAAKAGLSSMLRSLDLELRPRGIAVTLVEPGFIRTDATLGIELPLPFALEADRAALLLDRAIQRQARVVRFPWQAALSLRLVRMLPGFALRPLLRRIDAELGTHQAKDAA